MLIRFPTDDREFSRKLITAISRWARALDADEREFSREVLRRIESHAKMAEIREIAND